ncbi:MAG: hypothetical protein J0I20_17490 [Chloroflexi bacterium]|nr:hypothetical protein [Chloroflexota bacterium]OJV88227.1 MAG: hypothetical protein BGO39_08550 [Chloroflexi bacterium 54-19]
MRVEDETTGISDEHERIYLELDTFLAQKLLKEEAMSVAKHFTECNKCLERLVELMEVKTIFFVVLNTKELTLPCKLDYANQATYISA